MGPPEEKPAAELEIYRPGDEFGASRPAAADLAARMGAEILRRNWTPRASSQANSAQSRCFAEEPLPISGWSSQGTPLSSRRAAIGCMLDRLTLLASGHEPKLAELFARAKLKRAGCGSPIEGSVDWMAGANDPRLRGPL